MLTMTFCGGAEVEFQTGLQHVVTIFGGTDVFYPTVTESILQLSESAETERPKTPLIFTFCGGVAIRRPLLGREYMDLKRLLAPGGVVIEDFRVLWMQRTTRPLTESYRAITVFGACELVIPKKRHEMEELDRLARNDDIDRREYDALAELVGGERRGALSALPDIATRSLADA